MKRFFLILIVLMSFGGLFAIGQKETAPAPAMAQEPAAAPAREPVTVHIMAPSGTPALAMSGFAASDKEIFPGYTHEIEVVKAADLVASKMIKGEADIAVIPSNLASVLYSKGVDIKVAGIVIWGNLYLVSADSDATWEDMKGQEIYMLGRGLTPDIVLRHLMTKNGLDPETDMTLHYVGASSELAPSFITGKSRFSIMPEPMLTVVKSKKPDTNVMIDLQKEWSALYGTQMGYPQVTLVVSGALARDHGDYVQAFLKEFAASVAWMGENPGEAGAMGATLMPELPAPVLTKSLPGCNMIYTPIGEARKSLEDYYGVLLDFNANTIGGALPGDDFYLE
ncbi:MAG: ABC transporter substrate-binding protein [Spirochaetales bacterium]|nr:ABC transporter substrate-binding protein [Spirochaetales bacterium]